MFITGHAKGSDGTTVRGITHESLTIALLAPTYAPDVDDSDQATWQPQVRFGEVIPALDHTAQTQANSSYEFAARVSGVYSNSPMAAREGKVFTGDDFLLKENAGHGDHAADAQLRHKLKGKRKQEILINQFADREMNMMTIGQIAEVALGISEEDLIKAAPKGVEL